MYLNFVPRALPDVFSEPTEAAANGCNSGGEEVLLDVGGQDATEAFEDVGHSDEAREILENMLVGTLKREVCVLSISIFELVIRSTGLLPAAPKHTSLISHHYWLCPQVKSPN